MKKQVWLRPDQYELVVDCLEFTKQKLCEGTVLSDAHKMAGRFCYRRIDEVLAQMQDKPAPATELAE
jgi:hypothetical protein